MSMTTVAIRTGAGTTIGVLAEQLTPHLAVHPALVVDTDGGTDYDHAAWELTHTHPAAHCYATSRRHQPCGHPLYETSRTGSKDDASWQTSARTTSAATCRPACAMKSAASPTPPTTGAPADTWVSAKRCRSDRLRRRRKNPRPSPPAGRAVVAPDRRQPRRATRLRRPFRPAAQLVSRPSPVRQAESQTRQPGRRKLALRRDRHQAPPSHRTRRRPSDIAPSHGNHQRPLPRHNRPKRTEPGSSGNARHHP